MAIMFYQLRREILTYLLFLFQSKITIKFAILNINWIAYKNVSKASLLKSNEHLNYYTM
jgi:hypothetical protein